MSEATVASVLIVTLKWIRSSSIAAPPIGSWLGGLRDMERLVVRLGGIAPLLRRHAAGEPRGAGHLVLEFRLEKAPQLAKRTPVAGILREVGVLVDLEPILEGDAERQGVRVVALAGEADDVLLERV